jgi:nuclear pore complex protein Nup188
VNYCDQIEIHHPISIPGMEGITLPHGTHGYILKIQEDGVALVRWEVFLSCAAKRTCYMLSLLPVLV